MFTTEFNGQFSHQKTFQGFCSFSIARCSFLWRICCQGTLAGITAGGNVVSRCRLNIKNMKLTENSSCQSLGKYFERARTERDFACLTRETRKWLKEWPLLSNRKIINEQKKTFQYPLVLNTEPLSIFTKWFQINKPAFVKRVHFKYWIRKERLIENSTIRTQGGVVQPWSLSLNCTEETREFLAFTSKLSNPFVRQILHNCVYWKLHRPEHVFTETKHFWIPILSGTVDEYALREFATANSWSWQCLFIP